MDEVSVVGSGDARYRLAPLGCAKPASTYQGSVGLPFQRWYRFKEAFSPRFVMEAIESAPKAVGSIVDPFSGSGTTALTAQFLGIRPWAVEVNPFLADLAEAKLGTHVAADVCAAACDVLARPPASEDEVRALLADAPRTLVEPGEKGRWVFDLDVAGEVMGLVVAIDTLEDPSMTRLLRVLLASCVVGASNTVISGKGRRYRGNWRERRRGSVRDAFRASVDRAVQDIRDCGGRAYEGYDLVRGDAREVLHGIGQVDMALMSPPYPNSFDYTDVYNLEL